MFETSTFYIAIVAVVAWTGVKMFQKGGTGKLDLQDAIGMTNTILGCMPTRNCHSWISLLMSTKFLGSLLASASGDETQVLLCQAALMICMEVTNWIMVGERLEWQHLLSCLLSLLIVGILTRHVSIEVQSFERK